MRREKKCGLGFANLDFNRQKRKGFPEAIYAPGKTDEQLKRISERVILARQTLLITKLKAESFVFLSKFFPGLKYNPLAHLAYQKVNSPPKKKGLALVVSAGTSDIPIAEEAACVLDIMGGRVRKIYDAGVAGVHRIINRKNLLRRARVIVVVAGMEGALASVVSGLVRAVVIAVPTSVGYGANFKGLSALLTMLNSCSPGVAVVNIDNGFGAGYLAGMINNNYK